MIKIDGQRWWLWTLSILLGSWATKVSLGKFRWCILPQKETLTLSVVECSSLSPFSPSPHHHHTNEPSPFINSAVTHLSHLESTLWFLRSDWTLKLSPNSFDLVFRLFSLASLLFISHYSNKQSKSSFISNSRTVTNFGCPLGFAPVTARNVMKLWRKIEGITRSVREPSTVLAGDDRERRA